MTHTAEEQALILSTRDKVLVSDQLRKTAYPKKLFEYLVNQYLEGRTSEVDEDEIEEKLRIRREVSEAAIRAAMNDLRTKIQLYNAQDGKNDPVTFELPKKRDLAAAHIGEAARNFGSYEVRVTFKSLKTEAQPAQHGGNAPGSSVRTTVDASRSESIFTKKHPWIILAVVVVVVVAAGWLFLQEDDGFTTLSQGGFVRTDEDVRGVGPKVSLNRYLIVEPQTFSREKFVQAKLLTDPWRVPAQFGEPDTTDGTRFRVFVLVTRAELQIGRITGAPPQDSQEFFEVTVTLRK